MELDTCYRCGQPESSKEHVPPSCLFPEYKDVKINLRKNLITVPSCELHNSKKSSDDEFLMMSITSLFQNNLIGFLQTHTKINRAYRRKNKDFLNKEILRNAKSRVVRTKSGTEFPVLQGNMNTTRLIECFRNISYGLYRHEHQKNFQGVVQIILGFADYEDNNQEMLKKFIARRFDLEERALEIKGENPSVFTYQFCSPDEFGLIGMKMTFYGGTTVYAAYSPKGSKEPYNIGMHLINEGIPTTLTLGDEKFEFNKKTNANNS